MRRNCLLRAGLHPGDIIVAVDGMKIEDMDYDFADLSIR